MSLKVNTEYIIDLLLFKQLNFKRSANEIEIIKEAITIILKRRGSEAKTVYRNKFSLADRRSGW